MNKKISLNYLYNLFYTIFNLIMPFILLPYITKVLGKKNIGINSFTFSISQYFIFLGTLGMLLYGAREIAYVKDDQKKLNETFFDLFIIKILSSLFSYLLFFIFIQFQNENIKIYLYLYSLSLIGTLLDTTWLFQGLEDFKKLSIRNFFIRTLTIISVFYFVKTQKDLNKYIFIISLSNVIAQLVMIKYILIMFNFKDYKFKMERLKVHLKNNLKLFILQIAIQIYAYIDKIMLGYFGYIVQTGYYDIAQQIIKVGIMINGTLATIMMPRISNLFSQNKFEEIKSNIENSLIFSLSLSYPMILGMLAIIKNFILWFLGEQYLEIVKILPYMLPVLFIVPIGNVLGIQLMIPLRKEMIVTICPIIGAFFNTILNYLLIPKYIVIGAVIGTIVAEFSGSLITWYFSRKWVNIKKILLNTHKSFFSAVAMYFILIIFNTINLKKEIILLIQIILGIISYFFVMYLLKEKNVIEIINKLKRRSLYR